MVKDGLRFLVNWLSPAGTPADAWAGSAPEGGRPAVEPLEARLQMSMTTLGGVLEPPDGGPPPADLLPDLMPWASKPDRYVYGWRIDRTDKPGRTLLRLTTAMANVGAGPLELRGGPADPESGRQDVFQRIFDDGQGHHDRLAGQFRYHPSHNHVHFDDFAVYRLRYMTETGGVGRTFKTGHKVSFCLTDSDEYDLSLPGAPNGGEYFACSSRKQGISVGWADVYDESLPEQWIDVTDVAPGKYWLEVVVDPKNSILESDEGNNSVRIPINLREALPPKNDDFADRQALAGTKLVTRVSNENATRQLGEPRHADGSGGSSLWWSWTAPRDGTVTITTRGSEFDTLLGVYTGKSLNRLTTIKSNDDARGEITSRVSFTARKGVTYQIAVDGYRGATGDVRLTLRQAE